MANIDKADFVGPADVVAARFQDRTEADAVRTKIEAMGYSPEEVSYVANPEKCSATFTDPGSHWARMALGGAAVGGAGAGSLGAVVGAVSLGSAAFLGPVGLVAGAAIGGVVGLLLGAGLPDGTAQTCAQAVEDGSLVMVVQTHAGDTDRVRAALGRHIIGDQRDDYNAATPTP